MACVLVEGVNSMEAVRSRRSALAVGAALALGASLALPAALAQGAPAPSASVKAHVNGSQAALKLAIRLSSNGQADAAFKAFLKSRTELGKARAGVISLLKGALTPLARADAAKALALLGMLEDTNVSKLTGLLDDVDGTFQKAVAKANLNDTAARDRAIGILQALLPGLPAVVQGPIGSVIGSLMNGNGVQLSGQASLLAGGLVPDVSKLVSKALGIGLQGQAQALVGVQSIIGAVPGPVQQQLESAMQIAKGQTETAFGLIDGALGMTPAPVRSTLTGIFGQVQGVLNTVFGMLGQLPAVTPAVPAVPAATPAPGVVPSVVPDLGGIIKCVFPNGVPTPASLAGGVLPAGLDPTKILGCLTGGGLTDPTGIVKCIFPAGLPTGAAIVGGFDPTSIVGCVLKLVPNPMGVLNAMPDLSGILKCVFPAGLPSAASVVGGALPAGFDPMKIAGCVMQGIPFIGGGLIPNPTQLVGSFLGGMNPFNILGGLFGGSTGGSTGGGFLGGLLPF
jgi:hypothetical protein